MEAVDPNARTSRKSDRPTEYPDCDIIFSGLNSDVAGDVEMAFLKVNFAAFSNGQNFRLAPLLPLIVPVVNPGHIESTYLQGSKAASKAARHGSEPRSDLASYRANRALTCP